MKQKKVISIEDKIPTLKEERKKKANRRLLFYLSFFFILIAIIVYLQSPLSHIKEIHISGNRVLTEENLLEITNLSTDTNIWTIGSQEIASQLEKLDMIKSVEVKKHYPSEIAISIEEHKLIGFIPNEDHYLPIISNGKVLDENAFFKLSDAPVLNGFEEKQFLDRMVSELAELPDNILQLISELVWLPSEKNKYKIRLYMNDGFIVQATMRDFASKMKNYPSIVSQLEDTEGIIHMSVGSYFEKIE